MTTFERIDITLKEKGIAPSTMAKELKYSSGLYSQWKSGLQKPSAKKIEQIAQYLNVPVGYLLTGETTAEPQNSASAMPELRDYHTNHIPVSDADRVYIRIVGLLQKLCGPVKANALLSATGVSNDHPAEFTEMQLCWFSSHLNSYVDLFKDDRVDGLEDVDKLRILADDAAILIRTAPVNSLAAEFPEVRELEYNYLRLYMQATQENVDPSGVEAYIDARKEFNTEALKGDENEFKEKWYLNSLDKAQREITADMLEIIKRFSGDDKALYTFFERCNQVAKQLSEEIALRKEQA